jgi:hypothetical protein
MAKVIALSQFDVFSVDLSWYYRNNFYTSLQQNGSVRFDGVTYPDVYSANASEGSADQTLYFLGSGLSWTDTGEVISGTVNAVIEYDVDLDQPLWYATGISVSAAALYNAARTLSNADELSIISSALSGDDQIILSAFADRMSGYGGNDIITGGLGADWLEGGSGNDTFSDTAAGLNGDTLADFTTGDRIVIRDASLASFSFSQVGTTLTFSGGSLTFGSTLSGTLVATAAEGGGVQLTLRASGNGAADGDFNGDGRSDVILQSSAGGIIVWRGQANGTFVEAAGLAANSLDASWKVAGIGDFNGDGRDDILWRHSSGVIGQWSGQSGVFTNNSGVAANPVDNSWSVAGIADYNGDGRDDILWRHSSGEIGQWLAQPNGSFSNNGGAAANLVDPSWTVVASGDFNGDGRSDILWRHTSGVYAQWQGSLTGKLNNNGQVMSGATASVVGSGDFNGDGRDDILMRNGTTGAMSLWTGQTDGQFAASTPTQQLTDLNWKVVSIGDYDGDGRDDLVWQHSSGAAGAWLGTATGDFLNNGLVPSVGSGWTVQSPDVFLI